jgi:hypothetical protein
MPVAAVARWAACWRAWVTCRWRRSRPRSWGGAAEDGVLVVRCQGHLQARLPDRAAGAHLLGGALGLQVAGVGVEQLQVLVPAGGVAQDLGVEGDAAGQAGQPDGHLGGVLALQAGQRPGRAVGDERHAAPPPARESSSWLAASAACHASGWAAISARTAALRRRRARWEITRWHGLQ